MELVKQTRLLPAGCQQWNVAICAAAPPFFAYAATQTVYIYRETGVHDSSSTHGKKQWQLYSTASDHYKTITCVQWSNAGRWLVTAAVDLTVCVRDVCKNTLLARISVPEGHVEWPVYFIHPGRQETEMITFSTRRGPFYIWRTEHKQLQLFRSDMKTAFNSELTCSEGHAALDKFALAHINGTLTIITRAEGTARYCRLPELSGSANNASAGSDTITTLSWDPLSEHYLLVASSYGRIMLLDTTTPSNIIVLHVYDGVTTSTDQQITSYVKWFKNAPGMFLLAERTTGAVRIYNVSQNKPLERIATGKNGFQAIDMMYDDCDDSDTDLHRQENKTKSKIPPCRLLTAFRDGSVGVFRVHRRCWQWLQAAAHSETVFDVKFQPDDRRKLATASYDGTVRVWSTCSSTAGQENSESLRPTHCFRLESTVYAVSWAPADLQCLAAATAAHGVAIINVQRQRVIKKIHQHSSANFVGENQEQQPVPIYNVAWCQADSRRLASAGDDGSCVVRQVDGTLVKHYQHPAAVYGCEWRDAKVLATTCGDGGVRIFDIAAAGEAALCHLNGHTQRTFQARWHPRMSVVLATGSDDGAIRVWNFENKRSERLLEGHSSRVRALTWSPELLGVLFSGSWDATIRIWDVIAGVCLHTISEHIADVYGLTIHERRPFMMVSSSRDSTVRLWDLTPLFNRLICRLIVAEKPSADTIVSAALSENASVASIDKQMSQILSGTHGAHLANRWACDTVRRQLIIQLIAGDPDSDHFCDLLDVCAGNATVDTSRLSPEYLSHSLVHWRHIRTSLTAAAAAEAANHQTARPATATARHQQQMRLASIQLRAGQLRSCCEQLIKMDEWERALSLAPGVSHKYWRKLTDRYASKLTERQDAVTAELYLTAINQPLRAAQLYNSLGYTDTALSIHLLHANTATSDQNLTADGVTNEQTHSPMSASTTANSHISADSDSARYTLSIDNSLEQHLASSARNYLRQNRPLMAASVYLSVDNIPACLDTLMSAHMCELSVLIWQLLWANNPQPESVVNALICLVRRCASRLQWEDAVKLAKLLENDNTRYNMFLEIAIMSQINESNWRTVYHSCGLPTPEDCESKANKDSASCHNIQLLLLSRQYHEALEMAIQYVTVGEEATADYTTRRQLLTQCSLVLRRDSRIEERFTPIFVVICGYEGARQAARQHNIDLALVLIQHTLKAAKTAEQQRCQLPYTIRHLEELKHDWQTGQHTNTQTNTNACLFGDIVASRGDQHLKCYVTGKQITGAVYRLNNTIDKKEQQDAVMAAPLAVMWAHVNPLSPLNNGQLITI